MNSYLTEQIGRVHRTDLIDEAAATRLARGGAADELRPQPAVNRPATQRGFLAALKATIADATAGDAMGFMPRLGDYPTARH